MTTAARGKWRMGPAADDDAKAVAEVLRSAMLALPDAMLPQEQRAAWADMFGVGVAGALIADKGAVCWVARRRDERAAIDGFVVLEGSCVTWLAVRPKAQGQGLGTMLIQQAQHIAKDLDLARLTVRAPRNAVPFLKAFGFRSLTVDAFERAGTPLAALVMERRLSGP